MLKEFKEFINQGNVVDLAIAVVIGAAFGAVIKSFTDDVLMQIIAAIFGKPDFSSLTFDLGDGVIRDEYPGVGPLGGIVSALRAGDHAVFVLAGDMPGVTSADVAGVLAAAERDGEAWAVLAATDHPHPCFGLYRSGSLATLQARLGAGEYRLTDALPAGRVRLVPSAARAVANVNRPSDLNA